MPDNSTDEQFLQQALDLAKQSIGLASPNPYVGAVIVDVSGNVVGTGTHIYNGLKHAEILAIEAAGAHARGGTLYINFEPCSHHGRTPPCADAVITAGIRRVVASMADPNPGVSGRGFEKLRTAGIAIEIGGLQEEARQLNESFARYIRHGIPFVTLKSAMTLNGKIAPSLAETFSRTEGIPPGGWITSEASRAHVHELRHQNDALLVGIGTILADDPLLTDRSGRQRRRPLLRVVLDSHLRLPLESRLVQSVTMPGDSGVIVFYSSADNVKKNQLETRGIRVEQLPGVAPNGRLDLGRLDLPAALRRLGELKISSVMIEGGSTVNGAALSAGVVDKIFLYYAPKIFLGANSIPFVTDADAHDMSHGLQMKSSQLHLHRFGEDFAVEGYLRDPYGEQT